jgi:hypothetical protein
MHSIKKKYISCIVLGLSISSVFANKFFTKKPENAVATVLQQEALPYFTPPFDRNGFEDFKEALAFKESQGNYQVVNKLGYLGKYQFGSTTLERFDILDTTAFLANPALQEKAFVALCKVNKWILRKDIKRSVGKKINGIFITESGIIAAAHLAGAGNVKKFLRSNGAQTFSDAFGTTVEIYLEIFAAYDTSSIEPNRKPKLIVS